MIEEKLYSALTTSTLITSYTSNRIYPVQVPQEVVFPFISYSRTGSNPINNFGGVDTSLENALIQVEVLSTSYATSKTLRKNVLTVLSTSTYTNALFDGDSDRIDTVLNTDKKVYVVMMDFSIWGDM